MTPEERLFVEDLLGNTRDKGAYMKLSVLILLDMDKRYDEIEAILGIGRGLVSNCRKKYESTAWRSIWICTTRVFRKVWHTSTTTLIINTRI